MSNLFKQGDCVFNKYNQHDLYRVCSVYGSDSARYMIRSTVWEVFGPFWVAERDLDKAVATFAGPVRT